MNNEAQVKVCKDILRIMETYHEQMESMGYVSTPGGLEHMGDVWGLFLKWESALRGKNDERQEKRA